MQSFPIAPLSKLSLVWHTIIIAMMPGILLALLLITELRSERIVSIPLMLILLITLGGLLLISRRRRIELHGQQLTIVATIYTRKHHVEELDLEQARILRLDEHKELKPVLKTNGYAIPGFQAGHFRSRKWKKMFCLVTNAKVLLIPLKESEASIMISPARPQVVLDALKKAKTSSA